MKFQSVLIIALSVLFFIGCGGSSETEPPPIEPPVAKRSFYMGFTPWLYEASTNAIDVTYSRMTTHGDMIKHHIMGGIPWQEALDQTPYHENVEGEINDRLNRTPSGTKVFLAIDSTNSGRDGLSLNWGANQNEELPGEWANRSWSSPEVIEAYINFSIDMINRFQPTHFEYGTEASELLLNDPTGFAEFIVFSQAVHTSLSVLFPDLKLMTSIALKSPSNTEMQLIEAAYGELMPYTDVLGVSTYPYVFYNHNDRGDPANMSSDWLTQVSSIAGTKPLAISETGWIGEDLDIAVFGYSENSDETKQAAYATILLQAADDMDMEFVIWWTVSDFDTLWNDTLFQDPVAKIWKDIGLYDGDQNPRAMISVWDNWLNKTYQEN